MYNREIKESGSDMATHFSNIAEIYRELRSTDIEPIETIRSYVNNGRKNFIVDVGAGTGRYDELLLENLESNVYLTCVDQSPEMLDELTVNLKLKNYTQFETIVSDAEHLTLDNNCYDFVVSFNAIHHFNLDRVLKEMARVTKVGGFIFIYTRTPIQNENSIWGRNFPLFKQKENRLFHVTDFEKACSKLNKISLSSIVYYDYKRQSSLFELIDAATSHHYSTFALYDQDEFKTSLDKFSENIKVNYESENKVRWEDGNILYVIRKTSNSLFNRSAMYN